MLSNSGKKKKLFSQCLEENNLALKKKALKYAR
jgi:hypothetical protein